MIITKSNQITIISPGAFNVPGDNYSLLLQDKLSKQIYIYNLESKSKSNLYWRFNNQFTQPDNEYEYILIHNPYKLEIELNVLDITKSTLDTPKILVVGDDILTCDIYILTAVKDAPEPLRILDKGYLRIGDYKASITDYSNNKTFIVYEN